MRKKCTCLTMQSDFIVKKMSRSIGKMKLCGLYRPEKVQNSGPKQGPVRTLVKTASLTTRWRWTWACWKVLKPADLRSIVSLDNLSSPITLDVYSSHPQAQGRYSVLFVDKLDNYLYSSWREEDLYCEHLPRKIYSCLYCSSVYR